MYCPNCGNDCGDARFCVKCGTELSREEKKMEVWTVGMPCPHCGGTQLDGRSCAFCGAQLVMNIGSETIHKEEKTPLSKINLDEYCVKYWPNRVAAIKALNAASGIGIVAAKAKIDEAFDSYEASSSQTAKDTELSAARRNLKQALKSLWNKG